MPADEPKLIHYRADDGLAFIEMDNPPANTYTYEMMRQLDEAVLTARFDKSVQVVVVSGRGDKFFSAGADIAMLAEADPDFKYYFCLHANETLLRLEQTPKLFIAALNGHTVGGGLEVAMACDLRIAKRDAGRMGLPEVGLGVLAGTGGTQRLPRLVGKARAIELMVTGRTFSFEEGVEYGLVNDIFDPEDFAQQVEDYARQFLPPYKASRSVGAIKRAVCTGLELPLGDGLALERELQSQLFRTNDAYEGLHAYVEKRVPRFQG